MADRACTRRDVLKVTALGAAPLALPRGSITTVLTGVLLTDMYVRSGTAGRPPLAAPARAWAGLAAPEVGAAGAGHVPQRPAQHRAVPAGR
jgi:hypothetical protein